MPRAVPWICPFVSAPPRGMLTYEELAVRLEMERGPCGLLDVYDTNEAGALVHMKNWKAMLAHEEL